ncbi:MerR family transcriptional regulator [Herbiconiux sp. P15]|uniref:MerR family transcriptional regulator n=1 Tax=Herbiconiux liukaitaii TaxID=3342799 RepID=UPI0035B7AA24
MRMSQLAAAADLPVATVKFYLREGLLHEGRLTSPNQADYDDSHLERLQLVRALVGPAQQSIASTRRILAAIADPPSSAHDLLGIAHVAVTPEADPRFVETPRAERLLERLGWGASGCSPAALGALEAALDGLEAGGFELSDEVLERYAHAMMGVAEDEIAEGPTDSAEAAARYVILGTVLVEPLLLSLRRLAQQTASAKRFGSR